MKYVILLGDGMPDWPIAEKENKTPLMLAHTPNLDYLAKHGDAVAYDHAGRVRKVPDCHRDIGASSGRTGQGLV